MVKNQEINGTEEIGLVTPTPGVYDEIWKVRKWRHSLSYFDRNWIWVDDAVASVSRISSWGLLSHNYPYSYIAISQHCQIFVTFWISRSH